MGSSFEVVTDNNPLTYVLTTAKLDATGHRWVSALANFNFSIKYRSGKQNVDADILSRHPDIATDSIQAICQAATVQAPCVESLPVSDLSHVATEMSDSVSFAKVDWQKEQLRDPVLSRVVELRRSTSHPGEGVFRKELPAVRHYLREWRKLHFTDNVLYRSAVLDGQPVEQLLVPGSFKTKALKGVHDLAGHQGKEKTVWLAKQRFYWPGLEKDIECKVENCPRCIRRKTPAKPVAQLKPIVSTYPMELVCIDFLTIEPSKGGWEHVLVITDHFTRYAQAIPCRNQTAQTTAKALYDNLFRFFSFPTRFHSDQGRNFESRVIKELCKLTHTEKTRTTPYHPMGNGSAERFNQTLLKMLGTLENSQKPDWKTHIGPLVQAYNATKSDATGFSPHFLMFGWHPRLSVDAYLGTAPVPGEVSAGPHTYGSKLKARMQLAYDIAAKHAGKVASKNKKAYDKSVKESSLEIGDRVLVKKVGFQGKHKLADKWEEQPYIVCSIPDPTVPVYKVRPECGSKGMRTLHRNMLLPFTSIPVEKSSSATASLHRTRQKSSDMDIAPKDSCRVTNLSPVSDSDGGSSDSDTEIPRYVIPQRRVRTPPVSTTSIETVYDVDQTYTVSPPEGTLSFPSSAPFEGGVNVSAEMEPQTPQPPSRPIRNRKPPDRFGQWVYSPQLVWDPMCEGESFI